MPTTFVKQLAQRVAELEKRVAALERAAEGKPVTPQPKKRKGGKTP